MVMKESGTETALPACLTKHGTVNRQVKHSADSRDWYSEG